MPISAKELAQKLNVSAATISMVLHRKEGISPATRDKVIAGAREYGFDLSRYYADDKEQKQICFLIFKKSGEVVTDTPFFSELTEGVSTACKNNNATLSIDYIYSTFPIAPQLKPILERGYSGLLLLATEMALADFEPFFSLPCPLMVLDCYYDDLQLDTILINNLQGAYLATCHLAEQGIREIGYLKSNVRIANFEERADGYYKALRLYNIKKDSQYVLHLSPSMEGSYEDMKQLLREGVPLAKAYYADNDLLAAGALRALTEAGIRVPEDVSLIGFDDVPICNFLTPSLSTMTVPKLEIGMLAIEQLLSVINLGHKTPIKISVSPTLTIRDSVKLRTDGRCNVHQ